MHKNTYLIANFDISMLLEKNLNYFHVSLSSSKEECCLATLHHIGKGIKRQAIKYYQDRILHLL